MAKTETRLRAGELDDPDLERELRRLHETRHETFLNGSAAALQAHTERMLELEKEYANRFPAKTEPDPMRTREGARQVGEPGAKSE